MNQITTMPDDKWWPFARQADYDAFNANLKSSNRKWKEAAIQSWIQAWKAKPTGGKDA